MTADPEARVAELFDSVADTYDAVGVDFFEPIAAGLVAELAPRPGERALDVGCGRGAALLPLAAAVGPTGHVHGIDAAPRMIELTQLDVDSAGVGSFVEVAVGDANAPDVPPATFDLVASSLVLFFLSDPLGALRAWREVLRDDGRLGVTTFGPFNDEWNAVEKILRSFLPPEQLDPRSNTGGPFSSDDAMEQLVRDAGYVDVRTATTTIEVRFEDPDAWYRWSMSHGQRQFWQSMPAGDVEGVRATATEAIRAAVRPDGRLGFDQVIRHTLARKG
jgi:ubiquinone/menaquinone biosynthesis C-methylase UbiE